MTVVSSPIASMVNGVSQQPAPERLSSQCELLENAYCSVVKGVMKRSPFRHLAKLINSAGYDSAYLHTINRDAVERYAVIITNGNLQVFSLVDGSPRTVNFPNGTAYLNSASPSTSFAALTVADYTFIANKGVTVAMNNATLAPTRNKEAIVYVKQGSYGETYTVTINGSVAATYTTSVSTVTDIQTDNIAEKLRLAIVAAAPYNAAPWVVTRYGSVLWIKNTAADFTISSTDGMGDTALITVKDSIQRFGNLPVRGVDGMVILVTGDSTQSFKGYYVKYVDSNTSSNAGSWVECTAQGAKLQFDSTTMPWQLVRNPGGDFTFDKATWTQRGVGDDTSAPQPSFIGKTISDVFFHRNRLGFLAGQNAADSKSGSYFNFWPDTITAVLDSDRIDVAANHTKVSTLRAAVPDANGLILFSDQTQFTMNANDILTPKTVTIKPVTEFENGSASAKPVYTGRFTYFPVPRGSFTGIREFQNVPLQANVYEAPEITSQVPKYIPTGVFKLAASSNENTMAVLTTSERNAIYIYKWFLNVDQKLQSSWSKWKLDSGDVILNVDFIQTDLYAVIQRADGVYLEVASIELGRTDSGFTFQVNLDRRSYLTGVYNAGTNLTTWTLPYADAGNIQVILGPAFTNPNLTGTVLTTTRPLSTTIAASGDYSAGPCYVGRAYTFRYRYSDQYVREYVKGGGFTVVVPQQEARLQLNHMSVSYEQTGYFRAEVTPDFRPMATYTFSGSTVGSLGAVIGSVNVTDGLFKFPILAQSTKVQIDLVNDTYLPCSFQSSEWEGKLYIRSQRV